jgi:vacuolar-type H+-ATPase subunit H
MGWATAAMAGFSLLQASNTIEQGKAQASAYAQQGTYQAKQIADNTVRKAGTLQTSFLQSGITLDGGAQEVLSQAFGQGTTDINRTIDNANNQSKNIMNQARTKALSSMASMATMAAMGGGSVGGGLTQAGSYLPDSFAYGLNDAGFGNTAYDMLAASDARG